jgi:hypothetical protein
MSMTNSDMERKRALLKALAAELGVRLKDATTGERGAKFRAERFKVLAETAEKFENVMHGSTTEDYNIEAEKLVDDYWNNHLDRTEKSNKGGARKGYRDIIKCGRGAGLILKGLQARHDHWQVYYDHLEPTESPTERARRRALARRYLQQRDAKKYLGRPHRIVDGIVIHALSGGSPLDSCFAAVARYFLDNGERVLTDEFLDAMLDNGGPLNSVGQASGVVSDLIEQCEAILESGNLPSSELSLVRKALKALRGAA